MADVTRSVKLCGRCHETKSVHEFSVTNRSTGALHSYCRTCLRDWRREWRAAHPGRQKVYKRKWEAAHREEHLAYRRRRYQGRDGIRGREWRSENPEHVAEYCETAVAKRRAGRLNDYYKWHLTASDVDELRAFQNDCCAICGEPLDDTRNKGGRRKWHIDHDHACCAPGKNCGNCIRGILCAACNQNLGWFEARRERVLTYLNDPPAYRRASEAS